MQVINAAGLAWSRAAPGLRRVAVIFNPDTSPQSKLFLPVIGRAFCPPKSSAEMLR
jgi:hypothetical protein